ncbi:TIGR02281 family clan AA aspartic protease [Ponticoccus sp. SC2-23]|uniref:retropepsin-like aspartic protease family protein n=1 Tax=Alexandriicola marinus TaxID=2081710 RepID=UPI000FDA580C|nr:TIGR02281 family clan AA aspartic protease [Alexandriicola marinus]MBM1219092.1 TIGR02281 family clan AA aspartic protease [Ponticoccus sp. SC6-9]MBM1223836.1 TIGR02281 family clan AA aspartic protease [Ponticoccus sp. SC6-15]MBM1228906.1 TIGR02281 family clan AA aspartic protease [Ponticoccus sp. SC6-38]MBM1232802.1 TIGR02281 family clan AA aspartic protease [Ponticoccus sp. SC6-45]MBM1237248.1 TIGR02281 family clan AA aspartic protease [Ponticoccus sp. SC6-49]MBM1241813.1 TIGR02281 famil
MSGDNIAQLAYLGLLGAAVAGWFFAANRESLGKVTQQAIVWVLIFLGVIAAAGLWSDIRRDVTPTQAVLTDGRIEVPVGRDGHYHLTLEVNGTPIDFVVDTGASQIVLTQDDARRVGIDPATLAYVGRALTANGPVGTANVWLDEVRLGGWSEQGVRAVVNEGDLFQSLLGMTYLSRMARIEIVEGRLILTP